MVSFNVYSPVIYVRTYISGGGRHLTVSVAAYIRGKHVAAGQELFRMPMAG